MHRTVYKLRADSPLSGKCPVCLEKFKPGDRVQSLPENMVLFVTHARCSRDGRTRCLDRLLRLRQLRAPWIVIKREQAMLWRRRRAYQGHSPTMKDLETLWKRINEKARQLGHATIYSEGL